MIQGAHKVKNRAVHSFMKKVRYHGIQRRTRDVHREDDEVMEVMYYKQGVEDISNSVLA